MKKPTPYPLSWPANVPRTERKATSQFRSTLSSAMNNVKKSLQMFGSDTGKSVTEILISSNFTIGVDKPADSGVAVWFVWQGLGRCIAVDRYSRVEDNLQAIHHILEARRTEARHGGLVIAEQTFAGFTPALPPPNSKPWRTVFGFLGDPSREQLDAAYKKLAKERHPDVGGSHEQMTELNNAYEQAKEAVGG